MIESSIIRTRRVQSNSYPMRMGLYCAIVLVLSGCISPKEQENTEPLLEADHPWIQWVGRTDPSVPGGVLVSWPGVQVRVHFYGSSLRVGRGEDSAYYNIFIGDSLWGTLGPHHGRGLQTVVDSLPLDTYAITLYRRNESFAGSTLISAFVLSDSGYFVSPLPRPPATRRLLFLGNSITCGYGNLDSVAEHSYDPATQDHYRAYPSLVTRALGAEQHTLCFSGKGVSRNFNNDDTTATLPQMFSWSSPRTQTPWDHRRFQPHAVVINLGTNDFSPDPPDSAHFVRTFADFLDTVHHHHPEAAILLLDGPMVNDHWPLNPVTGEPYPSLTLLRRYLEAVRTESQARGVARVHRLELESNSTEIGYGADWHPNLAQHQRNAAQVQSALTQILSW